MVDHVKCLLLIVLQCFCVTAQICGRCPNGWVYFEDSCYLFAEKTKLDWTEASHYCRLHHQSELVAIETAEENAFVKDFAHRLISNEWFWTGASDSDVEGVWYWYPEQTPLGFTNWYPGEPNSYQGHDQDCMGLYGPTDYTWHDNDCTNLHHPLCELRLGAEEGALVIGK